MGLDGNDVLFVVLNVSFCGGGGFCSSLLFLGSEGLACDVGFGFVALNVSFCGNLLAFYTTIVCG